MQKSLFWLIGVLLSVAIAPVQAQDKLLAPKDLVSRTNYPQTLFELGWQGTGASYYYVSVEEAAIMGGKPGEKAAPVLKFADLQKLMPATVALIRYISPVWDPAKAGSFAFEHDNALWYYDSFGPNVVKGTAIPAENGNLDFTVQSAQWGTAAYTLGNRLHVSSGTFYKKQPFSVTPDDGYQVATGIAAHRSEFGITKGIFWAPDGKSVAFYRQDQHMVRDFPLTTYNDSATADPIKYPMAGTPSHHVTVGVLKVGAKKPLYLQTGLPAEQYLTNITWSPDGKAIYVAVVNRDQNEMKLNRYNAATGALEKTLFEEKHDKFVEPEHGPIFLPGTDGEFLWFSERDGYPHLYRYKTDGTLVGTVTKGDYEVTDFLGFTNEGKSIVYMSTEVSPTERHAYVINLDGTGKRAITTENGTHTCSLSPDGKYLTDQFSSLTVPNRSMVIEVATGAVSNTLLETPNPLTAYKKVDIELITLKAGDGVTTLHGRLIKPANFDATKKYPVMVYVYGGPHAQMVTNSWLGGSDLFQLYMAQRGFVVLTVDNRGSAHRGLAFDQATFRQLGTVEIEDQMQGVKYLQSLPYVDTAKMAVFGWSFGGFMTTSLMTRKPGTFKVGVAGGPVIDWKWYEIMYTERYMDTPQQNPDGYAKASLLQYIPNLRGDLLLIHGLLDDTVVPLHSSAYVNAAIGKGVQVDYFPYPLHPHNVRGKDRAHLLEKVGEYIIEHLK